MFFICVTLCFTHLLPVCYSRTGNHKATTRGKHGSGTEAQKLKGGKQSLYLDIYHQGRRQYEFLRLYLERDNRAANKEVLRLDLPPKIGPGNELVY